MSAWLSDIARCTARTCYLVNNTVLLIIFSTGGLREGMVVLSFLIVIMIVQGALQRWRARAYSSEHFPLLIIGNHVTTEQHNQQMPEFWKLEIYNTKCTHTHARARTHTHTHTHTFTHTHTHTHKIQIYQQIDLHNQNQIYHLYYKEMIFSD